MNVVRPVVPISVIIPCYRCAQTIGRAVESVFAQSVIPHEVILVEDCSGDGTLEVIEELQLIYPERLRIQVMDKNHGAASARNVAWSIATQPYIVFLDADDSWHPEKLRIQYDYMQKNPGIALCGHQCVWLRDKETPPVLPKYLRATDISAWWLLFRSVFSTPTVMLKRDIPFRFQEGKRFAEDLLLWQQIAFAGLRVIRLENPMSYVHKPLYGAGGLSAQLWKMEVGELSNFISLFRAGNISFTLCFTAIFFSIVKFIKRLVVTKLIGFA